jgi:hypothetical protein
MVAPTETSGGLSVLRLLPFPAFALAAAPAALLAAAPPGEEGPWIVLAAPWRDAGALIAAAGGQAIGPAEAPLGRLAASDAAGFPGRAAALGLLVLDAGAVADLCGAGR